MLTRVQDFLKRFSLTRGLSCEEDFKLVTNLKETRNNHEEHIKKLENELKEVYAEKKRIEALTVSVIDSIGDMLWAKTLDGKYILANKVFREKFCYGLPWKDIEGKTDIELAKKFKEMVGDANHTFGELCADSDKIIHDTEESRQFLEHGLINGKVMRLIVNKSPLYDYDGIFYATCGAGRDVTDFYSKLERVVADLDICFGESGKDFIKELYKDIEWEQNGRIS